MMSPLGLGLCHAIFGFPQSWHRIAHLPLFSLPNQSSPTPQPTHNNNGPSSPSTQTLPPNPPPRTPHPHLHSPPQHPRRGPPHPHPFIPPPPPRITRATSSAACRVHEEQGRRADARETARPRRLSCSASRSCPPLLARCNVRLPRPPRPSPHLRNSTAMSP